MEGDRDSLSSSTPGKTRKQVLEEVYALAFSYEQQYGVCSQCVLAALQDVFGIVDDAVIRSAHALAGGAALMRDGTCGALSGGIMALGCRYGRERKDFGRRGEAKAYQLAKSLHDRFIGEYGSCICRDVQEKLFGRSFDFWNPEGYREFEAAGGHRDKCPDVVGKVALWVAEMLLDE